jgi:hypothetical protein
LLAVTVASACDETPDPFPTNPPEPSVTAEPAEPEPVPEEPIAPEEEPIGESPPVAEEPGGAQRARTWPCSSVHRTRTSRERRTYTYGGPAECTVPEFFTITGCPTKEAVRTGTEASDSDYDRAYLYAEDGRLARVEKRDPTSDEVQETYVVLYDEVGAVNGIEHTREAGTTLWTVARDDDGLRVTSSDGHFDFTLDDEDRITTLALGAFPGDTGERQSWNWRRDKLRSISHENSAGRVIAETEFSYDCR